MNESNIEVTIQVKYKGKKLVWDIVDDKTYFTVANKVIDNVKNRLKLYPNENWIQSEEEEIELTYNQENEVDNDWNAKIFNHKWTEY